MQAACTRSSWKRRWRCGPARTVLRGGTRQRPRSARSGAAGAARSWAGRCSMRCRCAANHVTLLDTVCATGRPFAGSEAQPSSGPAPTASLLRRTEFRLHAPAHAGRHGRRRHGDAQQTSPIQVLARGDAAAGRPRQPTARRTSSSPCSATNCTTHCADPHGAGTAAPARRGGGPARTADHRTPGHASGVVDDLLDVSRITRGKVELRRATVEASAIVARGIEMASPLLEQHRTS